MSQATAAAPAPTPKPAATPAPVPGGTPAPTARPAEGTDLAAARGIPSALTRWRLIAALGVLAFTALTVAQLVLGMNAASRAAADADQVIRIQDLKVDLLRADALATNAFLVGGLEPNAQRAAYDDALAGASTAITAAAEAQPADQAALAELSSLVLRYGSDMEVARANNRQGLPVGAAYLREASADLRGRGMTLVESLLDANTARAKASLDDQHPLWVAIPPILALVLLGVVNQWMAPRFRRRVNTGIAIAAVGVLALGIAAVSASASQAAENARLSSGEYADLVAAAQARGAANSAKSNESLRLVARGSGKTFEDAWGKDATAVRDTMPGESDDAWSAYEASHREIVQLDDSGDWDGAVKVATDTTAGSTATFTAFDDGIATVVKDKASTVRDTLTGGRAMPLITALLTLLGGLGATYALWQGIGRRLEEYS